jgi:hypothetical protein
MKEHLYELVSSTANPLSARQIAREYLQARILAAFQRDGAMIPLAFHGGTALRFLFGIPRFSEDLDFALERPNTGYNLRAYLRTVKSDLLAENYPVEISLRDDRFVHIGMIRFRGLLYDLGLSSQPGEVLMIKVEVDTLPPEGAELEITVIRRHAFLRLQHHDRASLLSGKLHAILQRPYAKGRDLFDLFWYLSTPGWPEPNLILLNNALTQSGWNDETLTHENWRAIIRRRLSQLNWTRILTDVQPFLLEPDNINLLTLEHFDNLLNRSNVS